MVKVKICGITSRKDAFLALDAGADALGFNLIPSSRRYIAPPAARAIVAALPPFVTPVGVFANTASGIVRRQAAFCGFDLAQLHGDETPGEVGALAKSLPVIKAIRVRAAADIRRAASFVRAKLLLFDSFDRTRLGGTGATFDWKLLRRPKGGLPFLLAGGLTPANVAEAVRAVRPYGVDVASGVESVPGRKERGRLERFIRAAKNA